MQTRAAEDILSLIRELKRAWFDGQLQTIGTSQSEKEAEKYAADVAEKLKNLAANEGKQQQYQRRDVHDEHRRTNGTRVPGSQSS